MGLRLGIEVDIRNLITNSFVLHAAHSPPRERGMPLGVERHTLTFDQRGSLTLHKTNRPGAATLTACHQFAQQTHYLDGSQLALL